MDLVCSAPLVHTSQMKEAQNASSAHSECHTPNQEQSENPSVSTYVSLNMTFKCRLRLMLCFLERFFPLGIC